MKRLLVLLLALLLLGGCAKPSGPTQTAVPTAGTVSETTAPESSRISDLTADTVLLYRQAGFKSREGTLLPLETVLSVSEDVLLPRSHEYDDCFPGESAGWLRLLDYAFANEYQGFSVRIRSLPALSEDQIRVIDLLYHIDDGRMCFLDVDGVVSGAVWSDYQWDRMNIVCGDLGLKFIAPMWRKDQDMLLGQLIDAGIEAVIVGCYAEGFDESWLGRPIDRAAVEDLKKLRAKYGISIMGEGGEYESMALYSPPYSHRLRIVSSEKEWKHGSGMLRVNEIV